MKTKMMLAPSWPESQKSMVETLITALREASQRLTNNLTQIARWQALFCPSYRSSLLQVLTVSKKSRKLMRRMRASYLITRVLPHHATRRRTVSLPRSQTELSRWFALATWQVATDRVPYRPKTSSLANSWIFCSPLAWLRMRSKMRRRATSKYLKRTIQTRSGSLKSRLIRKNGV